MENENINTAVPVKLPISTIITILLTLLLVHILQTLSPLIMPLFIGSLLAVALFPIIHWMESQRIPKLLAILMLTTALSVCIIAIFVALIPRIVAEFSTFLDQIPQMRADFLNALSLNHPLRPFIEKTLTRETFLPSSYNFSHFYNAGSVAMSGISKLLLILIFTIYLMFDGERVIKWSTAFFSLTRRAKIRLTFREVSHIIFAYASGQFITSFLSFLFSYIALSALGVPGALLLAVLAGVFDVLPVLGFFLAVFPAMIFAFRVSPITPVYVFILYLFYHGLENYLIAPLVYGNRLRISGFAVLISTLSAAFLAGIEGAVSILPVVASYPVIEKIWLRPYLGATVLEEHQRMNNSDL